jgi:hypothetical protein
VAHLTSRESPHESCGTAVAEGHGVRPFLACLAAASLFASITAAGAARAADPAPPGAAAVVAPVVAPVAVESPTTTWYGYQTLATDGGAVAFMVALGASHDHASQQGLMVGALTMYELGAPTVHFAHHQVGRGFIDLGLRIGLPVVGTVVGGALGLATASPATSSNWFAALDGELTGAIVGGTIGLISASAIDAVFLAREEVAPRGTGIGAAPGRAAKASVEPSFAVSPERQGGGRALLGIVGRF